MDQSEIATAVPRFGKIFAPRLCYLELLRAGEDSYEICRMVGLCTPIYPPKQIEGFRSASQRAHPVLAVSGMDCGFCGSSRSRMAFNAWI
jgi:hypothetical protein